LQSTVKIGNSKLLELVPFGLTAKDI